MKISSVDAYGRATRSFNNLPGVDHDRSGIGGENPIADMIHITEIELDLVGPGEIKHAAASVWAMRRFVATYQKYANEAAERLGKSHARQR